MRQALGNAFSGPAIGTIFWKAIFMSLHLDIIGGNQRASQIFI